MPAREGWPEVWSRMSDEELEVAAGDYLWVIQNSPVASTLRLDEIIAEAKRRGKADLVDRARSPLFLPRKRTAGRLVRHTSS